MKDFKDNLCPSCKFNVLRTPQVYNALSRRDNKTYVCSDCGVREAMEDYTAHIYTVNLKAKKS